RRSRGDLADQRQALSADRLPGLVDQELDRARLGRIAPQQADLLEVREVGVHGRGGVQPDRLADLTDRGRIAGLLRVLADEVEDLLLALGQIHLGSYALFSLDRAPKPSPPNTCS